MKSLKDRLQTVLVLGATPAGIAATNKLGELGISVTLVDADVDLDEKLAQDKWRLQNGTSFNFAHRPGLIRILRNPRIKCVLPARVDGIKHNPQGFSVRLTRLQTFVDAEKCILCGRCQEICPIEINGEGDKAVQYHGRFSLPGRPVIDKRRMPLCRANCPLGVNAQGYIALAKAGKYAEALALIRENNILPGVCGRICTHPCETECRREQLDEAVSIRAIKRFLADYETLHPEDVKLPAERKNRTEKVAVIGSGPAGLAAAAQMAKAGCQVSVFEKEEKPGGLLRYGIGAHRLPREILDTELAYIEKLGVSFVLSRPVNLGADLAEIRKSHDAVLVTTGSWKDRKLGAEGEELEGVEGCLSFLSRFYREQITRLNQKVAVIGDGNAAFDLARTLARLGAQVLLVSWFAKDQIPADAEEIKGALEEGVVILDQTQVTAFEGDNLVLRHLRCHPTRPGTPDAKGIAWPVLREDEKPFTLEVDKAFVAIGQSNPELPEDGLQVNGFGYISVNEDCQTSLAGVYAAGDVVSGPSTVVQAMAAGKGAADQILKNLCRIPVPNLTTRPVDKEFPEIGPHAAVQKRTPMPEKRPVNRQENFSEVALGLSEADVAYEAQRCLQCGVCAECLQCLDVCNTIKAIHHDETEQSTVEHAGVLIIADPNLAPTIRGEDVIRTYGGKSSQTDIHAMVLSGFAAAARAMVLLGGAYPMQKGYGVSFSPQEPAPGDPDRIGVFVCNCNHSLGWLPAMDTYVASLGAVRNVVHTEVMTSACTPEGSASIVKQVRDKGITRMVLGACVCCSLDFICSACTDQRSRLKQAIFSASGISRAMVVTRNIRGEALSLLKKEPDQALKKFKGLLKRSVSLTKSLRPFAAPVRNYNFAAAVIGVSEAAVEAALTLSRTGMDVFMFSNSDPVPSELTEQPNIHCFMDAKVNQLSGTLGDFKIDMKTGDYQQSLRVGTVILGERSRQQICYIHQEGLAGQPIASSMQQKGVGGVPYFYPGMTSISGLFLANPPGIRMPGNEKGEAAAILAAAVMPRGPRRSKGYTVVIDSERCRGCGRCSAICPFQAVTMMENGLGGWHAVVDEAFCKGCGNCTSVCPTCAADSPYRDQSFFEQTLEEILLQE
ncbi:MAG: FAD-dependent oxidoreductase [Proteobacteria bacterium]|nr:FAD-dependent oxidoreductase [Pseudomonadota bacterium]